MLDDVRARAANPEHEWDRRALDWPLTMNSVVVEVGGYCGRWALQIAARYHPRLFVFEPQPWAADVCRAVLGDQAQVVQAALGTAFGPAMMDKWETDGCSLVESGDRQVVMIEIGTAFQQLEIGHIDLMLMNIEGYEHTLIPYMLSQGIRPRRLMVQCHGDMIDQIDGYRMLWTYGMVLTAWGAE
jgi:FkbM family methyltransferase